MKKIKKNYQMNFCQTKVEKFHRIFLDSNKTIALFLQYKKKNKAVIFLYTMHNTIDVEETTKKSIVNLDYNATKGGVHTVD